MLTIRNYEETQEELLIDYDQGSFYENWQMNETWEVGFVIRKTIRNRVVYDLVSYESSVIFQGQQFVIKEMQESAVGEAVYKKVVATHVYYTIQDGYQYNKITGRQTPMQLLMHILGTGARGFTWQLSGGFPATDKENFGDANYLRLINEVLQDFRLVVIPDNKHLRFMSADAFGKKVHEPIRFKHNTDEVIFDIDTYNLKTQIRGFGALKEGVETDDPRESDYVFPPVTLTSQESAKWGIRIQDPVRDERYHHQESMMERLRNDLQDTPNISGVVKLKWKTPIQKGDHVPFIYEPMGISTYIQVVGLKTFPLVPNKPPEVVLSNTKKTMTKLLVQLRQKGVV